MPVVILGFSEWWLAAVLGHLVIIIMSNLRWFYLNVGYYAHRKVSVPVVIFLATVINVIAFGLVWEVLLPQLGLA